MDISRSPAVPPSVYPTISIKPQTGVITTLATTQIGTYTLYIYALDSNNSYSVSTFILIINALSYGKIITNNIIVYTNQNKKVLIKLEASIPQYLKNKTQFIITSNPSNGLVNFITTDTVEYIPNNCYYGTDSFQY
jgi:hypothetical protein